MRLRSQAAWSVWTWSEKITTHVRKMSCPCLIAITDLVSCEATVLYSDLASSGECTGSTTIASAPYTHGNPSENLENSILVIEL